MKAIDILKRSNLDRTHWGRRIIEAERRGRFDLSDGVAARSWTTCACGKLDKRIPRYTSYCEPGEPKDRVLYREGNTFSENIDNDEFAEAATTLVKIEARAAQVLRGK